MGVEWEQGGILQRRWPPSRSETSPPSPLAPGLYEMSQTKGMVLHLASECLNTAFA